MQLPIKVEAELGQREIFNLENRWTSMRCLRRLQNYSSYMWSQTVSSRHLNNAAPHTTDDKKLVGVWERG